MAWSLEVTVQFDEWWDSLDDDARESVNAALVMLEELGPRLPLRVSYAFDPRRVAVLLLGDDKRGSKRWYRKAVPRAERLFDNHLENLKGGA